MKVQSVALEMCLNLDGRIAIIYASISLNTYRYCVELRCLALVSFIIVGGEGGVFKRKNLPMQSLAH
jgi:hypothetical protein